MINSILFFRKKYSYTVGFNYDDIDKKVLEVRGISEEEIKESGQTAIEKTTSTVIVANMRELSLDQVPSSIRKVLTYKNSYYKEVELNKEVTTVIHDEIDLFDEGNLDIIRRFSIDDSL